MRPLNLEQVEGVGEHPNDIGGNIGEHVARVAVTPRAGVERPGHLVDVSVAVGMDQPPDQSSGVSCQIEPAI
jgi:hypothetical protein